MKKLRIIFGILTGVATGVVIGVLIINKLSSENVVSQIHQGNESFGFTPKLTEKTVELTSDSGNKPLAESKTNSVSNGVSYNFDKLESLQELERQFSNLREGELQDELSKSKRNVASLLLIEKANRGNLTGVEAEVLALEMRKQTVLHKLIIDSLVGENLGPT